MKRMMRWLPGLYARQLSDAILQKFKPSLREQIPRIQEALDEEPAIETFTFVAYEEGGVVIGSTGTRRLVCVADSGAKVVVFGHESELKNINAVLEVGLPSIVRCEAHPASQSATRFSGHTHWVWEYSMLEVAPLVSRRGNS